MRHRIKELRLKNGLTQEKMAEIMNLSKGYIYQIEAGKQAVSDRFIDDVCRIFRINEEWLRTGKGPMLSAKTEEEEFAIWAARHLKVDSDSFKRRFVRAMMNLSDDDWKVLEKYINDMTKDPAD